MTYHVLFWHDRTLFCSDMKVRTSHDFEVRCEWSYAPAHGLYWVQIGGSMRWDSYDEPYQKAYRDYVAQLLTGAPTDGTREKIQQ